MESNRAMLYAATHKIHLILLKVIVSEYIRELEVPAKPCYIAEMVDLLQTVFNKSHSTSLCDQQTRKRKNEGHSHHLKTEHKSFIKIFESPTCGKNINKVFSTLFFYQRVCSLGWRHQEHVNRFILKRKTSQGARRSRLPRAAVSGSHWGVSCWVLESFWRPSETPLRDSSAPRTWAFAWGQTALGRAPLGSGGGFGPTSWTLYSKGGGGGRGESEREVCHQRVTSVVTSSVSHSPPAICRLFVMIKFSVWWRHRVVGAALSRQPSFRSAQLRVNDLH